MNMSVVNLGIMPMFMSDRLVFMEMVMCLVAGKSAKMFVLMVFIMHMTMLVYDRFMQMFVIVLLSQV